MNDRTGNCGCQDGREKDNSLLSGGYGGVQGNGTARLGDGGALHGGAVFAREGQGHAPGSIREAEESEAKAVDAPRVLTGNGDAAGEAAPDVLRIPAGIRASVASRPGEYDARRLRSQREIIRDVMISAADCETWLTLGELRALTRYGEASISAQLRHLRKAENGGYDVIKRHREGAAPVRPGTDGRSECVWEYRITRGMCGQESGGGNSRGVGAAD